MSEPNVCVRRQGCVCELNCLAAGRCLRPEIEAKFLGAAKAADAALAAAPVSPNPLGGLSWGGFNIQGDEASIARVKEALHALAVQPEFRAEIARLRAPESPKPPVADERAARVHALKCWPQFYSAVADRTKLFEIRRNDRDFRVGDALVLQEWSPETNEYTGAMLSTRITYVTDWQQQAGYVVLGLADWTAQPSEPVAWEVTGPRTTCVQFDEPNLTEPGWNKRPLYAHSAPADARDAAPALSPPPSEWSDAEIARRIDLAINSMQEPTPGEMPQYRACIRVMRRAAMRLRAIAAQTPGAKE